MASALLNNKVHKYFFIYQTFALCLSAFYCTYAKGDNSTVDSLRINTKSSKQGLDSTIHYSARDSAILHIKKKSMILQGNAEISLKQQGLKAETIEIDFNQSLLQAQGQIDSSGRRFGFPAFNDNGEEFTGEKILFNLQTQKGTITMGESKADEGGFYYGSKVKKVSENTLFIENGCYTTCTQPHPHFYFGAPKMKVVANDRVFLEPIMLYVEDVPIFMLPIGLYFPNKTGRSSGILVNVPYFSTVDGVVFQNMGYYFALSDYYDTQITADIFSKTGFLIRNNWRYNVLNSVNGTISIEYGRRSVNAESPLVDSWRINGQHSQTLSPQSRITASINVATQSYLNRFATDLNQRLQQSLFSNAGYSTSFDNGSSLGIDVSSTQNIITKEYNVNPNISYNIPTFFPVKNLVSGNSWIRDIGISYFVRGALTQQSTRTIASDGLVTDTSFAESTTAVIRHNPSISISPKLGYFAITPSITYNENWFFRTVSKNMNQSDSTIEEQVSTSYTPLREFNYQIALGLSTRLFGMIKPRILGINALRHTLSPTVSFSFSPEYTSNTSHNIERYFDYKQNQYVEYSRFEKDGGKGPSRMSQSINYSISNRFEAKVAEGDTAEKNIDLLQLDVSGSCNLHLDSLQWSGLGLAFRTISIGAFNLNGNAGFTLYDEELNSFGAKVPVNKFLYNEGKGLARLTYFSANISAQFASGNMSSNTTSKDSTSTETQMNAGDRFNKRYIDNGKEFDYYGELGRGYSSLSMPWSLNGSITYNYNEPISGFITRRFDIRADMNIRLTETWNIKTSLNYDAINAMIVAPSISITKDLDCWELSANWYPTGFNQGFILRFSAKAAQLRDLAITKRNLPAYR